MTTTQDDDMYDMNIVLIRIVEQYPNLYDKSSQFYKDNLKKKEAWENVIQQFNQKTGCSATVKQARNRWGQLKTAYTKERVKLNRYTPSGSARQPEEEPWLYFNELNFLEHTVAHRKRASTFILPTQVTEGTEFHKYSDEEESEDSESEDDNIFQYFPIDEEVSAATVSDSIDIQTEESATSQFATANNSLINQYLICLREQWEKIPIKNRKACYIELKKLIDKKKAQQ